MIYKTLIKPLVDMVITGLGGFTKEELGHRVEFAEGVAYVKGQKEARINFSILPLPFTDAQLKGREYGNFITPNGFAQAFGEENVPAPGPHGYTMVPGYVARDRHLTGTEDIHVHHVEKFAGYNSETMVPVILVVLR